MRHIEILNDFIIEIDTECDCFDFEMNDLAVDIEEHNATVLQAVNSLAEQIARIDAITDLFINKSLSTIHHYTVNSDDYKLIKQQYDTLHKQYIARCIKTLLRDS